MADLTPDRASRERFATLVLQELGAPVSDPNIAYILGQMDVEGVYNNSSTRIRNNPLCTTQNGHGGVRANSVGVKAYPSMEAGAKATAETLRNGRYPTTLQALQTGHPETASINPMEGATWSGSADYTAKVLRAAANYTSGGSTAAQFRDKAGAVGSAPFSPTNLTEIGARNEMAVAQRSVRTVDGTAATQELAVAEGLDNVPWWEVEGILLGNRKLRRIPDAITFLVRLPETSTRAASYLGEQGASGPPVLIRLTTGLTTMGQGMSHQNSVEPTGSGLLLNLWGSRPDMITASGTTGVFQNQYGLTSLMSLRSLPEDPRMLRALQMVYGDAHLGEIQERDFRVAAQDAFVELLHLFKNNGIIRYLPRVAKNGDDVQWSRAMGISGYQMRHRVGDVMAAGRVAMIYKGRTILGQFKSFSWTASAESPYRWEFNFTFRAMEEYVPYLVGGL